MNIETLKEISPVYLTDLPVLWEQNNILILLIDLDTYNNFNTEHLDISEKKYLEILKTSYFKKRYIISRLVLKEIIYSLLKEQFSFKNQSLSEIHTYKDEFGRIHLTYERQTDARERDHSEEDPSKKNRDEKNHNKLHVCISYTSNIISLAISKVELGVDIELKKPLSLQKLSGYLDPFKLKTEDVENNLSDNFSSDPPGSLRALVTWTLKEAYCKFSNIDMLSNLSKTPDFNNVFYSIFYLSDKYILSLVTDKSFYANSPDASQLICINYLRE